MFKACQPDREASHTRSKDQESAYSLRRGFVIEAARLAASMPSFKNMGIRNQQKLYLNISRQGGSLKIVGLMPCLREVNIHDAHI